MNSYLKYFYFQQISLYLTLLFSKMSGTDDFSVSNSFSFLKISRLCYFFLKVEVLFQEEGELTAERQFPLYCSCGIFLLGGCSNLWTEHRKLLGASRVLLCCDINKGVVL